MGRVAATIKSFLERPDAERRLGPFLLVKPLGSGGFAPVWLAREVYESIEVRTAAVKLFSLQRRSPARGPETSQVADRVRAGIIAETSALCKVEHPNVVRFYSHAIDEESGVMGLAMEHIAGTALDRRLAKIERLSVREALAVGSAIASALAAVHRAGLVHRDVKPSNVIEASGVYKLIDFGIAAAEILGAPDSQASAPEIIDDLPLLISPSRPPGLLGEATMRLAFLSGTPGYMDPVCVATREPATPASDLYALGAMLFECLSGKVPAAVTARRGTGLDEDVLDGFARAPALSSIAPDVPPLLGEVIDTLLAPARADRPPSAEWVAARFEQIRGELTRPSRSLPPEDRGPFRGLGRFEERDQDVYFGRRSEITRALDKLRRHGLVTISGSSGSGKSSLARAGVLPTLADGGLGVWPEHWDTAVTEPGRDPRAAVALALDPFVIGAGAMTPEALVAALGERAKKDDRGVILLVDQLEELATLASEESQSWTADLLVAIAQKGLPGVRALCAARRDLLDPLLAMGGLGEAMGPGLVLIKPITDQVWGDVLDQALSAYGYTFEDDALRSDLLAELEGTAGAMPLVQFALTELWHKRDAGAKKVTRKGLEAIGGIAGALERHAEATLESLARTHPDAESAARTVLIGLTTPQGTRSTRKLADLQREAGPAAEGVIAALERARLIVRSAHGITLAHEALLTQWGRLRAWAAEARQDRLLAEELERDAERWGGDAESVPLWPRRRVALGEELRSRGTQPLSASAVSFLRASRWASHRMRLLGLGSALVVSLSLLGFGTVYVRAERRSRLFAEAQNRALQFKQREIDALMQQLEQTNNPAQRQEITQQILDVGGKAKAVGSAPLPSAPPVRVGTAPVARSPIGSPPITPLPPVPVTAAPAPASAALPTDFPSVSSFPEPPSPP
jgi:serine/threonine protein kinase